MPTDESIQLTNRLTPAQQTFANLTPSMRQKLLRLLGQAVAQESTTRGPVAPTQAAGVPPPYSAGPQLQRLQQQAMAQVRGGGEGPVPADPRMTQQMPGQMVPNQPQGAGQSVQQQFQTRIGQVQAELQRREKDGGSNANPQRQVVSQEPVPASLAERDRINRANGMYTTLAKDAAPPSSDNGDLTRHYNDFERKQLEAARKKDFESSLGSKSFQAADRYANESAVRAQIDPVVQQRLSLKPKRNIAAENAEREQKRLEGDKRNRGDAALNVPLATLLTQEVQKSTKGMNLTADEVKGLVQKQMESGNIDLGGIASEAVNLGFDKHMDRLKKEVGVQELEGRKGDLQTQMMINKAKMTKAARDMQNDIENLGDAGRVPLSKGAETELNKKMQGQIHLLGNLHTMEGWFDPKFFETFNKARLTAQSWSGKLGVRLSDEDKKHVRMFTQFKQLMADVKNERIHDLSGGAVTVDEAKRLVDGIISGELSPTEAATKLNSLTARMQRAYEVNYKLSRGLPAPQDLGQYTSPVDVTGQRGQIQTDGVPQSYQGPSSNPKLNDAMGYGGGDQDIQAQRQRIYQAQQARLAAQQTQGK